MRHFILDNSHYTDFKTLRKAYIEVKSFIECETGDEVSSLNIRIDADLGCVGDDNWELINKFVTKYNLDSSGFKYSEHFLSEGELFNSLTALLTLITLPLSFLIWLVKLISFGRLDLNKRQLTPDVNRKTIDMTFGDMLTWYITGHYNLRKNIQLKIKNVA